MTQRRHILAAVAAALPTTGDGVKFASVHRGWARSLAASELPAAIVRRGEEIIGDGGQGRGWATREMEVLVEVRMAAVGDLDDAMDDYLEAVEQAVLYSAGVAARCDVLPDGVTEIEYDDESDKPTASTAVRLRALYTHYPSDPSTSPVGDPYEPDSPA